MVEPQAPRTPPAVRQAREADLPALLELTVASFGDQVRERMRVQLYEDASHLLHQSRLVEIDGVIASYIRVSPRPIHYGAAVLPMGGIGAVCAHPRYRGYGLPSAILADCIPYMRDQGYVLSMLFTGIQGFYARLGWVPFPESSYKVSLPSSAAPTSHTRETDDLAIRPFADRDLEAVEAIYAVYNARHTGMAVRDTEAWRDGHRRFLGILPCLVAERAGKVVAYASAREYGGALHVYEGACLPACENAFNSLATGLLAQVRDAGLSEIQVRLSQSHGLYAAVRAAAGMSGETLVSRHMMVRVLDLTALLRAALPAFVERLALQPWLDNLRASFTLEVAGQAVGLTVERGCPAIGSASGAKRLALPQELFWEIFFGASTLSSLREHMATLAGVQLDAEEEAVLAALFPLQDLAYSRPDHF